MKAHLKFFTVVVIGFYGIAGSAAPMGGNYQAGKIISKSIAPPEAPCDMFLAARKQITMRSDGVYQVIPTFEGAWIREPIEGPAYECKLNGAMGTCSDKAKFDIDLSSDGLSAVLTFSDQSGEHNQWIATGKFQTHQNSQISCKGDDCGLIFGTGRQCTMNILMEYNLTNQSY